MQFLKLKPGFAKTDTQGVLIDTTSKYRLRLQNFVFSSLKLQMAP